jgi:hypothetical protein
MTPEDRFGDNYYFFAGNGEDRVFLDSIPFRAYMNAYFGSGRTHLGSRYWCIHWVFTPTRGKVFDSIRLGHQPRWDQHCTLYGFYYELFHARLFNLEPLKKIKFHTDYIDNLICVYEATATAFIVIQELLLWFIVISHGRRVGSSYP